MKKYINDFANQVPRERSFWINKFTITIVCFLVWICFIDKNNVFIQYRLSETIEHLEEEKLDFENQLTQAISDKEEMEKNIERFARKKYFMHKENEDIYILDRE